MPNLLKFSVACATAAGLTAFAAPADAKITTFADYVQVGKASDLTWLNPVVPKTVTVIPAVTKFIPAVTQFVPAVTKIVNGKVVVVTPAHTIVITPAHTVVVTPAKTITTPAHDGTTGTLFSTNALNSNTFGLANVKFAFQGKVLSKLGPLNASFSFQGTAPAVDPALGIGGFLDQPGITGTFSFTYTGLAPLHVYHSTYLTGANLLTGTFDGFDIQGKTKSTSGGLSGSTGGGATLIYTSDFLNFTKTIDRDAAFSLTGINPSLGAATGDALHSFKSNGTGAFSTDQHVFITAKVPEPATWTMMILGFGMLGAAVRQRQAALLASTVTR